MLIFGRRATDGCDKQFETYNMLAACFRDKYPRKER